MLIDIQKANQQAFEAIQAAQPVIKGIGTCLDTVPGMKKNMLLHAGPPITWEKMSGPMKGAVIGALIYEELAKTPEEAEKLAASGEIEFSPWHEHDGVGPMAGVASAKMPVWIVENKTNGRCTYCTLNEGLGKVLRFGAYSEEVITRLNWMEKTLGPVIKAAIPLMEEVNLKNMVAQVLQMGDEGHNRNKAGTSLITRELAPAIVKTDFSNEDKAKVLEFIHSNDHFFLNLSMPAAKAIMQAAEWIEGCTLLTTMCRNGTEFGIRVSGLKEQWFTGPAQMIQGLLFPGYGEEHCNPDIGDSAITETCGFGAFAMAAAPAIVKFVGGAAGDAVNYTKQMYEITQGESQVFQIPILDFRGSPQGIDIMKVCEKQILPVINTGIAHKEPGIGQVGAGIVHPPMSCFEDALEAYVEKYCD